MAAGSDGGVSAASERWLGAYAPQPIAPAGPTSPQALALPLHAPRYQLQAAGSQARLPAPTACRRLHSAVAPDGEQLLRSCSTQIPQTRALIDTHVTHAPYVTINAPSVYSKTVPSKYSRPCRSLKLRAVNFNVPSWRFSNRLNTPYPPSGCERDAAMAQTNMPPSNTTT